MEVLIAVALVIFGLWIVLGVAGLFLKGSAILLSEGGWICLALFIFAFPVMAAISVFVGMMED